MDDEQRERREECIYNTYTIQYNKKEKDTLTSVRVNKEEWIKFKVAARKMGYSANGLISLFIEMANRSQFHIEGKTTQINMNIVPVSQNVQTNVVQVDMKNLIIEKELDSLMDCAENTMINGKIRPFYYDKITTKAKLLKKVSPEIYGRMAKLLCL